MLRPFFILVMLFQHVLYSQHKVYLLDGKLLEGKVLEVGPKQVHLLGKSGSTEITVSRILLIDYGKGRLDRFADNKADRYIPNGELSQNNGSRSKAVTGQNEFYINTLSLMNADVSLSYEHISENKKYGLGITGAYNFNSYASGLNAFIALLSNGKKTFDFGVFGNAYTGNTDSRLRFYFNLMVKYTEFTYSMVHEDSVYVNNVLSMQVTYSPGKGHQTAYLLGCGMHVQLTESFFMKYGFGAGLFRLTGDYMDQFNYTINSANQRAANSPDAANYTFLPKGYLSISTGWKF
ncbi:MAG TPA: hypothetical protein PLQ93_05735 [Bacteroidia bacterium]|nr:hypothetical protein [Bacteroidia bacterium]